MEQLKVFIITQQEPFYIPKVVREVLEGQSESYVVVGGTCLKPHRKNKSMKHWFRERARIYTYWELFITALFFFYCKLLYPLLHPFSNRNPFDIKKTFEEFDVPLFETSDLNDPGYHKTLRALDIDVIISLSAPQIFGKDLLNLPRKYCLNAHGTLLPRHRGVFGSWWMLFEEDKEIGSTIHTMEERLDSGEIIWQKAIATPSEGTQFSIAYHTKKLISVGLKEVLTLISKGEEKSQLPEYNESYHRAPVPELALDFRKKGKRIIKLKDWKYVLARFF